MASKTWILLAAFLPAALADGGYTPTPDDIQNNKVWHYMLWTWIALMLAMLVYRWTLTLTRHVRRIANLSNNSSTDDKQRYFTIPDENFAWMKKNLILAPFWNKRHNREFKLSAAVNVTTLPSRIQSLFLTGYLVMNIVFVTYKINWDDSEKFVEQAIKRFGILSTMNMIPLFLLAGRNNPLIFLLGVSFDTYNLIHRWIGRIAVLEGLVHTLFWMFGKAHSKGWDVVWASFSHSMIWSGTIAMAAFLFLLLHSPGIVRHAFYETFLHAHIIIAALSCAGLWIHLKGMPFQYMLMGAMILWILERAVRMITIIRHNTGNGGTKAEVEALPGDCVRVTLRIAKPWRFQPGQHLYMYMPSVGLWTSHPFSIAWSEDENQFNDEKAILPTARQDIFSPRKATTMSLVIRRRTGFTDKMWRKAEQAPSGKFFTTAFVEGPYGSQSFQSYGSVMLFAAGIGIAHQVPHIRDLVAGYAAGTAATRKVTLVWIIQSPEHLEWIRPWMTQILGMERRRDILKILLFVTRPRSTKEIHSPSSSVQMFPGKPDVGALVAKEQEKQIGAMAVSVCGTGSLADDLRQACRDRLEHTEIDFFEEAFSW
ncbi:putative FRE ferric reductase-like transmembrane component [Polychaeton citri CBS 116435]|uniref:ferric-chelate reductase (NADPH) n=1 Tax=Polychaeton citri CBS 116435 TaxID=1314669 RepID=A0A9P4UMU0_9PEZI|nr:putative FRE ferric reductase-like transmembrane component [Polychaeton citri CBS 116435]